MKGVFFMNNDTIINKLSRLSDNDKKTIIRYYGNTQAVKILTGETDKLTVHKPSDDKSKRKFDIEGSKNEFYF